MKLSHRDKVFLVNLSALSGGSGGSSDKIKDADNDTKIQVEENPDEDKIRFDLGGTEYFLMDEDRLEILNSDDNIFIAYVSVMCRFL